MIEQIKWLLIEGITPLFGAGLIYLVVGCGMWVVDSKKVSQKFEFAWAEAIDSMGWLYGALLISVQSAIRCFGATTPQPVLGYASWFTAFLCGVILFCAMIMRGRDGGWYAPKSMKITSVSIAIVILVVGFQAKGLKQSSEHAVNGKADTQQADSNTGGKQNGSE